MRWFRFYDEALDDPKVQRLPGDLFKAWVNLLCLASRHGGVFPALADAAFALRTTEADLAKKLAALVAAGLVDAPEGELMQPHGWASRQYDSDSAADRMRKSRERKRAEAVTVTADVTASRPSQLRARTDTEQIQNRTDTEQTARVTAPVALPFGSPEFSGAWERWEQHLREKRVKRTPTARDGQLARCAEWGEARAIAALRHSTECGYTGLFEPKSVGGGARTNSPGRLPTDEELAASYRVTL